MRLVPVERTSLDKSKFRAINGVIFWFHMGNYDLMIILQRTLTNGKTKLTLGKGEVGQGGGGITGHPHASACI